MKKVLIFIGGIVVGIILCIIIGYIIGGSNGSNIGKDAGKTIFETERDFESTNCFEVIQVLDSGDALACEVKMEFSMYMPTNVAVLLLSEDGTSYYDNQIIEVPKGKSAKQIGTYKYLTRENFDKTIPIIVIK